MKDTRLKAQGKRRKKVSLSSIPSSFQGEVRWGSQKIIPIIMKYLD